MISMRPSLTSFKSREFWTFERKAVPENWNSTISFGALSMRSSHWKLPGENLLRKPTIFIDTKASRTVSGWWQSSKNLFKICSKLNIKFLFSIFFLRSRSLEGLKKQQKYTWQVINSYNRLTSRRNCSAFGRTFIRTRTQADEPSESWPALCTSKLQFLKYSISELPG